MKKRQWHHLNYSEDIFFVKISTQQPVSCHGYLVIKVIITVVQVVMTNPPLVLHMDVMVKLVGLGFLQLHTHSKIFVNEDHLQRQGTRL